jgi:hypothetical protein
MIIMRKILNLLRISKTIKIKIQSPQMISQISTMTNKKFFKKVLTIPPRLQPNLFQNLNRSHSSPPLYKINRDSSMSNDEKLRNTRPKSTSSLRSSRNSRLRSKPLKDSSLNRRMTRINLVVKGLARCHLMKGVRGSLFHQRVLKAQKPQPNS